MNEKMRNKNFIYVVETSKSFEEAVVSLLKSIELKGWTVFQIYDIKERLAAKGFEQEQLKIIEICSAKHSNRLLNKNRLTSLCMPCRINVIGKDSKTDKVRIAGMNPVITPQFFPEVSVEDVLEIEKDIKEIIDNAK